ncbi:unnamed protein product [Paramecium primaurelia]|uniref:Uncharacterized protein n=1 Tax=Paramecium primaurelia TaxID=5886 RepID=A0A8S1KFG5_PARPR|nr:unnamed protein product [Paramecium primaurelia]
MDSDSLQDIIIQFQITNKMSQEQHSIPRVFVNLHSLFFWRIIHFTNMKLILFKQMG